MRKMKLNLGIETMIKELEKREKEQDRLIPYTPEVVRHCSNAIKAIHAREMKVAMQHMHEIDKALPELCKTTDFPHLTEHALQEIIEAKALFAIIERKKIPTYQELKVPFEAYLLGLADCIGELRREMLESLRHGKKKDAEYYFEVMSAMYEAMVPLRFSDSLLPNFRRKQDVARSQVEQARSELVRA